MGRGSEDIIQLATGPYEVTKKNKLVVADKIRFRHYKPDELQLAKDFIKRGMLIGTFYFDFYLMTDAAKKVIEEQAPPMLLDAVPWMQRIDAICIKGGEIILLEFKERLRASGVGQLLTYQDLYEVQFNPQKPVVLAYVFRDDDPSLHGICDKHDIIRYQVVREVGEHD